VAYQLIQESISTDTVEALEQMLVSARQGNVTGIAFVLLLKRRKFLIDCAGEACADPTMVRGCVAVLDDHLGDLIRDRTDRRTTM